MSRGVSLVVLDSKDKATKAHSGCGIGNIVFLDVGGVTVRELARALSKRVPTVGVEWELGLTAWLRRAVTRQRAEGDLGILTVRLQRGWWRSRLLTRGKRLRRLLAEVVPLGPSTVVVLTSPHAVRWVRNLGGCVFVYYASDNFLSWFRNAHRTRRFEGALCRAAHHTFVVSRRLQERFSLEYAVPSGALSVLPNAVRGKDIPEAPPERSTEPLPLAGFPRPWALVMGNLGVNTDWRLLAQVAKQTTWLSWVFVGPVQPLGDSDQAKARVWFLHGAARTRFVGPVEYPDLSGFARACDVAILPYLRSEATSHASPTRYYQHLAAGRPILATDAVDELLDKTPLVRICRSAKEMADALGSLHKQGFCDGFERRRWEQAQGETWEARAEQFLRVLTGTLGPGRVGFGGGS